MAKFLLVLPSVYFLSLPLNRGIAECLEMCNFLLLLKDSKASALYSLAELVPLLAHVTNLAASY